MHQLVNIDVFCVYACCTHDPGENGSEIVLVAVPLLVLLMLSVAACVFVLWLRSKRQHQRLQNHDPPMLKVPSGGDPTYGVCAAHGLQCLIHHAQHIYNSYQPYII